MSKKRQSQLHPLFPSRVLCIQQQKVNSMEKFNTPEKLCELLKESGISVVTSEILKHEQISGPEFLDLSEEDLKGLRVKMGQIKKLLKLQEQYDPQTATSKVSILAKVAFYLFVFYHSYAHINNRGI